MVKTSKPKLCKQKPIEDMTVEDMTVVEMMFRECFPDVRFIEVKCDDQKEDSLHAGSRKRRKPNRSK